MDGKAAHVKVGEVIERQCGHIEDMVFNGNVIWEKVGKLTLEDKLGIFESPKTNPHKYLRCKIENLKSGHAYKPG